MNETGSPLMWEQASLAYDVLVEECGAAESMRSEFIREHMKQPWYWPTEFRFQGNLGFGGKFWNETGGWRVSCFSEDETSDRSQRMLKANQRLEALRLRLTDKHAG